MFEIHFNIFDLSQHIINIKIKILNFFSSEVLEIQYFILAAHLSLDLPHIKCSVASCGQ